MKSLVILAVCIISGCAGNANFDDFMGQLTPVATVPPVYTILPCTKMVFSKNQVQKCVCADGKKTELIDTDKISKHIGNKFAHVPLVVVEDINEVTSLLNVTCDCGVENIEKRGVAKVLNDNYIVLYTPLAGNEEQSVLATVYAKRLPAFLEIVEYMKTIPGIGDKMSGVVCSDEFDPTLSQGVKKSR